MKRASGEELKVQTDANKGIALPLLVVAIPTFLLVVAFAVSLVRARFTETKYQTISDLAAKIGAGEACSTAECYNNSRVKTLRYIEQELFGSEGILDPEQEGTFWERDGIRIEIVRGRWIEDFEAMEREWDQQNPGIPSFITYNGVRVSLRNESLLNFLPNILPGSLNVRTESTAVARVPSKGECVAPFAIPLCSLLNEAGRHEKETICDADRIFTESRRYAEGQNMEDFRVPDFNFSPIADQSRVAEIFFNNPDAIVQTGSLLGPAVMTACSYHSQQYRNIADHFGVVGLPGTTEVTESAVQAVLQTPKGCSSSAKIGDPFQILDQGLTTPISGSLVENRYKNLDSLGDLEDYPTIESLNWVILTLIDMRFMSMGFREGCANGLIQGVVRRESSGICRSTRNHWGDWSEFANYASNSNGTCKPSRGIAETDRVWKVRVPVIGESGPDGRDCRNDQSVASRENSYQIIGFTTVYIFDSDIGEGPAELPLMEANLAPTLRVRNCSYIGIMTPLEFPRRAVNDSPTEAPFSFRTTNGARSCNMVRARIDCKSSIFPSADDTAQNDPYLVQ